MYGLVAVGIDEVEDSQDAPPAGIVSSDMFMLLPEPCSAPRLERKTTPRHTTRGLWDTIAP